MGIPLCFFLFPLLLSIFHLCPIFVSLITMCLSVFSLILFCLGFCTSWTWLTISFTMWGNFSAIISSSIFSGAFYLSSASGTPIKCMVVCLMLSQRSLRLSSSFFFSILFSVFCLVALISTIRSSRSLICSASYILPLIPSSVLFFCLFVL